MIRYVNTYREWEKIVSWFFRHATKKIVLYIYMHQKIHVLWTNIRIHDLIVTSASNRRLKCDTWVSLFRYEIFSWNIRMLRKRTVHETSPRQCYRDHLAMDNELIYEILVSRKLYRGEGDMLVISSNDTPSTVSFARNQTEVELESEMKDERRGRGNRLREIHTSYTYVYIYRSGWLFVTKQLPC